ncbi:hypothetical protein UK23_10135 [Lentzea aerocolonigenes]|uniref:Uncharacterized protein n=1 Tax=Lentzea aerocolonigenes TaxID=68170 RepID=A0A0F0H8F4_LENAE|nr:hypothetical protein [Lentzea aerocolonigenes]KJK50602.1 hypothetical protein UK23_10135 [Lentzea aerocolonigenes]
MTTTEVVLTSRASALVQRIISGVSLAGALVGMVVLAFADEPWWAVVLGELGLLVSALICVAIWSAAGSEAKDTVALRATGTVAFAEVLESTREDDGDSCSHVLKLWVPVPGDGFEVRHRCHHYSGEQQVRVLVDPATRTWGALH